MSDRVCASASEEHGHDIWNCLKILDSTWAGKDRGLLAFTKRKKIGLTCP